jgi:hypothetical protein
MPKSAGQGDKLPLSRPAAFALPLLGGRLLSAYYFYDWRGSDPGPETTTVARAARGVSALAYPLIWLGIAVGVVRFRASFSAGARPVDALAAVSILTLGLQCCLDGMLRIAPWPHYFTGTWIAGVACFWLGLRQLARLRWRGMRMSTVVAVAYSVGTIVATAAFVVGIHNASGGKAWYGPTMASQLDVPGMTVK